MQHPRFHDRIVHLRAPVLGIGLALLAACSGGNSLTLEQQLQQTGQSIAGQLPDASALDSLDGMIGNAHTEGLIGSSEMAAGMRQMLGRLDVPREIYRSVRAAMLASDTSISLARITDTRLAAGTYDTIRFERSVTTGSPPSTGTRRVRIDLALWDALGVPVHPSQPRAHTRVRDAYVVVQLEDELGQFDADGEVGMHVAIAFATGLPTTLSPEFLDAEFPDLPADRAGFGAISLFVDIGLLDAASTLGTSPTPEAVLIAVQAGIGTREIVAAARFADPNSTEPRVFDTRIEAGTGVTMSTLLRSSLRTEGGTNETLVVGFMELGGQNHGAGFAPDPFDLTQLHHAWDANGQILDVNLPYTPPASFAGWPGASTLWSTRLGRGIAASFETALPLLPSVTTWYPAGS
ncbi:MAG: hypothetical protein HZB39_09695 [Planctomycetes bacterium]|nr:hypothetical protein [Planctomycetota bacterium]